MTSYSEDCGGDGCPDCGRDDAWDKVCDSEPVFDFYRLDSIIKLLQHAFKGCRVHFCLILGRNGQGLKCFSVHLTHVLTHSPGATEQARNPDQKGFRVAHAGRALTGSPRLGSRCVHLGDSRYQAKLHRGRGGGRDLALMGKVVGAPRP